MDERKTKITCGAIVVTAAMLTLTTYLTYPNLPRPAFKISHHLMSVMRTILEISLTNLSLYSGYVVSLLYYHRWPDTYRKFGDWGWVKKFLVVTFAEEWLYRVLFPSLLHTSALYQPSSARLVSSILFSLSHVHQLGEYVLDSLKLGKESEPESRQLYVNSTLYQMAYTLLFGVYTSYVYHQTKSYLSVVSLHAMCNFLGVPKFHLAWHHRSRFRTVVNLTAYVVGIGVFVWRLCRL